MNAYGTAGEMGISKSAVDKISLAVRKRRVVGTTESLALMAARAGLVA